MWTGGKRVKEYQNFAEFICGWPTCGPTYMTTALGERFMPMVRYGL